MPLQKHPVCRKILDILEVFMHISELRKLANQEEIDYQFLMSALQSYSRPRDKISDWLKSGDLIRVKKGLYVFGKQVALVPYSLEILANLIYGPSAISLSYALSFYGLIPERVSLITSITNKRNKKFSTPLGEFNYYYLHAQKYAIGVEIQSATSNRQFLIASPEKALCDQLYIIDKNLKLTSLEDIESHLFQDMRIDETVLQKFNLRKLSEICKIYQYKKLDLLLQFLKKWKKKYG
jgi:hypothetical protein